MNRFTNALPLALALGLLLAAPAPARAATCVTDMDCPTTPCGGQVCQWLSTTNHVCQDAGSKSRGSDGWCNTAADCKCQSLGAKCNAQYSCSFTLPADAPPAGGAGGMSAAGAGGVAPGGAGGAGGAPGGAGGALASGGDTTGTAGSVAGSAGTSNAASDAGTGNVRPDAPITGSPSATDPGGCAVSATKAREPVWLGFVFLGVALFVARRRRVG